MQNALSETSREIQSILHEKVPHLPQDPLAMMSQLYITSTFGNAGASEILSESQHYQDANDGANHDHRPRQRKGHKIE